MRVPLRAGAHVALLTLLAACGPTASGDGSADPFERESRGGKLHGVALADFEAEPFARDQTPPLASVATFIDAAKTDTGSALDSIDEANFEVVSSATETLRSGSQLAHVRLRQHVGGVPIWGSYLALTAKSRDAQSGAKLLASSHHVYAGLKVATEPEVSEARAIELARSATRMQSNAAPKKTSLVLWPLEGRLDLVWSVLFPDVHERALVYASGPLKDRVIRIDERHYQATGTVSAPVTLDGAPGGSGTTTLTGLPRLDVSGDGVSTSTDASGAFVLEAADGADVTATLAGAATAPINDNAGIATSVVAQATTNMSLVIGDETDALAVANSTAYFFIDRTLAYLQDNGVSDPALLELTTNTNIADACNAFYTASSLNFFQAGAVSGFNCNNTAEGSIVVHEYGHFVDDVFGGITDSGLSEGWGDLLACFISDSPGVGSDFFIGEDAPLRTCDNDYKFPADGVDEVHNLGQAWAGFAWHAREGLIAELGELEGDRVAREIVLPSLVSNATDIPAAVRETFLRDDDDGDIENLTPHFDILLAAATRHNLSFVVENDLNPPAAITDLRVASQTATTVTLAWTASGDDGNDGIASSFDLRGALEEITQTNFAQAAQLLTPEPLEAGTEQQATINLALVPGETIFFAIKAFDEQNNGSPISNVIDVIAGEGVAHYEESFENGDGGWQASGLWHVSQRRAADGASAFWYGDEATGNYETGATNSGEVLSPEIDLTGAENPTLIYSTFFDVEASADFDRLIITIFDVNDPTVQLTTEEVDGATEEFLSRGLSLAEFADRTIQIRFTFDSVDSVGNTTEGWFVDNVRILVDSELGSSGLVINEILADPGSFDANGDGEISFRDDEFIELVNTSAAAIDLSGVTIADGLRIRFEFPSGASLAAGEAAVVFGGGNPASSTNTFVATSSLGLNNTGDSIVVRRADGTELATASFGSEGGDNQSLNRETDADANSPLVLHTSLAATVASPGTRVDGTPFGDSVPGVAQLMINEVLSNPGTTIDANGDGVFDSTEDEFVELANVGTAALDLSGATYSDFIGVRFTFPSGTILEPGEVLVLFGGGTPQIDGDALVFAATGSLFINNGGDELTIAAADGAVLAELSLGSTGNESAVRAVDLEITSPIVGHLSIAGLSASPGSRSDGSSF